MKFSRYNSHKEKYRPRSAAMILSGEVSGKMNRVCCGAVNSSWTFPHGSGGSHGDNQPLLQKICNQSTSSVGFVIENIMVRRVRQDDSEEIIYEWRQ